MRYLRKTARGALLVSSGQMDVRLVVEPRSVGVEAAGVDVEGDDERDLIRSFLNCLFWDEGCTFLDPKGAAIPSAPAIRIDASQYDVLNQIEQGLGELAVLRERVPGMDVSVAVSGEAPPTGDDGPAARLFRALERSPRGGHLGTAAEEARLDAIDAAWAVNDLVDAGQAEVTPAPGSLALRRLKHAEPLTDDGLLPAVRSLHLARGFSRLEPPRAARHFHAAGDAFLAAGHAEQALAAYRAGQELAPDGLAVLEGQVRALEGLGRAGEARRARERLISLYMKWCMPARARRHLDALPSPTPEEREVHINAALLEGDFAAAADVAAKLLPELDREGRLILVRRFAAHGATGPELARPVALTGLHALRPVRRALLALAGALLLVAALLGAEVHLRQRFHAAALRTQGDLERGDVARLLEPWEELSALAAKVGPGFPLTCLTQVGPLMDELRRIQADHGLLQDPTRRAALDWNDATAWPDVRRAQKALEALAADAQSRSLRARLEEERAALEAYRAEVVAEVSAYRALVSRGRQLTVALELLRQHPSAADLYAGETVPVVVEVAPVDNMVEVTWEQEGSRRLIEPIREGSYEVRLPLSRDAAGILEVGRRDHVRQRHVLRLADLRIPEVKVELYQSLPIQDPRTTRPPTPAAPGVYVRDDLRGLTLLQQELESQGGPAIPVVAPSEPELAFLADALDPRLRLTVQVVSEAHAGRRVYLERINLWLDDPRSERAPVARAVVVSNRPFRLGLTRSVRRTAEGPVAVQPIAEVSNWERVREALSLTLAEMHRELGAR